MGAKEKKEQFSLSYKHKLFLYSVLFINFKRLFQRSIFHLIKTFIRSIKTFIRLIKTKHNYTDCCQQAQEGMKRNEGQQEYEVTAKLCIWATTMEHYVR